MRLVEQLPELPEGEGDFWTHNTGGEHVGKFANTGSEYNRLRTNELVLLGGGDIAPIREDDLFNMMLGDDHEVVFVAHRKEAVGAANLVAGAIAKRIRKPAGEFTKRIEVSELVVHPDMRLRQVASYMLYNLTRHENYNQVQLTEMVFDTSVYRVDDEFLKKLEEVGFRHVDEKGSHAMWLPGNRIFGSSSFDPNNPAHIDGLNSELSNIGFSNYYIDLYPSTDPQTQIFRSGKLLAVLREESRPEFDDELEQVVQDFRLFDAGGAELDALTEQTNNEALRAALNNYDLVK